MAPVSAHSGYWGVPTATMDWCEQNYEVSIFWGVRVSKILTFGLVKSVQNLLQTTITTHVHNLRVNKIVLWYHTSPQVTWYVAEFWNTISNLAMIGTSISNSTVQFLRNSASSFHWLSSAIFNVRLFVVCPASVTPPLISTI